MTDLDSSDSRIQRFGRDVIFCIHYITESRNIIHAFQDELYEKLTNLLEDIAPKNIYSAINSDEILKKSAFKIKDKLNRFLNLRLEAKILGESLFNLSALRQLDEKRRSIGSLLLGNLNGLSQTDIIENLDNNYPEKDYLESLDDLIEMGYILKETKDNLEIFKLKD
jgi:hypothetical protein